MIIKDDVGGGLDWSLTSEQILYDTPGSGDTPGQMKNKGLRVFRVESGKHKPVVKPSTDHPLITDPRWSSEGSHVLFTTPCMEPGCTGQGVATYETGEFIMLPLNGGVCEWASNDLRIACIRTVRDDTSGLEKGEIVIMNERGEVARSFSLDGDPTALATLAWSADGETLLLGYYSNGKGQTDTLSVETGDRKPLGSGLPSDISPNGQWVLTWESGLNTPSVISIVNVTTGESSPLTEGMLGIWQPEKEQ